MTIGVRLLPVCDALQTGQRTALTQSNLGKHLFAHAFVRAVPTLLDR